MRAKVRRPKRRGGARWYYSVLAVIAAAGMTGIVLSAGGSASDTPPSAGDHWHSALAVNVCGEWLGPPGEYLVRAGTNVISGLHTHGDGFIHIEPSSSVDSGDNATVGRFFENGGWGVAIDSLDLWEGPAADPAKSSWSNGDKCPARTVMAGRKGVVKWSIDCAERPGDPSKYKLQDFQVVALAFLPSDEAIGVPPNASAAPGGEDGASPGKSCTTAGPDGPAPAPTVPSTATTSVSTTP